MTDLDARVAALENLVAVLCDPEGKCCISGSDADRAIVDESLAALRAKLQKPALHEPVIDAESPLSDVQAILYQCDRGNISLPWLIDALRGIVERSTLAPSQLAKEKRRDHLA